MGLELQVSEHNVKSLFTTYSDLLKDALRHEKPRGSEYSPNLYVSRLLVATITLALKGVPEYLEGAIGFDKGLYESRIKTAGNTWRRLVESLEGKHAENLDALIGQHVSQLKWIEGLYTQLSGLNTERMPKDVVGPIGEEKSILSMIIRMSNRMYNPKTRAEFLKHVHEGEVQEEYAQMQL